MGYSKKIWISKYFSWAWNIFGYCGHMDTCKQERSIYACTRYEVNHIEDNPERLYIYFDPDEMQSVKL